ncbi:MAG: VOC family protein [Saprospiraceae bacterium]
MAIDIQGFDHYTITVTDLVRSTRFYVDILGFRQMDRPAFDFAGAWFDIGNLQQIHLIEGLESASFISGSRSLHFAFRVSDIYAARAYLRDHDVPIYKDIKPRPDGFLQLFVRDPDGYVIELTQSGNIYRK